MRHSPKLNEKQTEELQVIIKKPDYAVEGRKASTILMLDKDLNMETIVSISGYNKTRIYQLRSSYLKEGVESIRLKTRGIRRLLKKEELLEIKETLQTKMPKDLGYSGINNWTTGVLSNWIYSKYEVLYKSKTSYYVIFKKSKLTFHKPGKVYERHDEEKTQSWIEEMKPIIEEAFNDRSTVILTEDEMVLSCVTTFQKIWLPVNKYPEVEVSNERKNRSMYGFLNIKTGDEHVFSTNWQNMYETGKVLRKIRRIYPNKKILLLWDNAAWHKGYKVQEYIKKDKLIQQIFFPAYSPELNPQEHVWKEGRHQITHNRFIESIYNTGIEFVKYLNSHKFNYSFLNLGSLL